LIKTSKKLEIFTNEIQIDLSDFSNGVYFIKVYCENELQAFKVIKEN